MPSSWWQLRPWKFVADMNRDGVLSGADVGLWAQWLFFMPGDAFIALFGPTPLGGSLGLTQASFGGATSAWISGGLWLVAICLAYCLFIFLLDAVDPTFRQQRRERRKAERRARREAPARKRSGWLRRAPRRSPLKERIEPTLGP